MGEPAADQNNPPAPSMWTVKHNDTEFGPYSRKDLLKLILTKQLSATAMLKRDDWSEFKPILDCLDLVSQDQASKSAASAEKRMAAPRISANGVASVSHNSLAFVSVVSNISTTGLFLKTGETSLKIGDKINIVAQVDKINKPFKAMVEVMRYSSNLQFGVGYGVKFVEIENMAISEISKLIGVRPISEFGELHSSPVSRTPPKKS